jgi:hypothetical protein
MRISNGLVALSLSGALVMSTVPVQAAMFTAPPAVAKAEGQAGQVVPVRFGGWHGGGFHGGWHGGGWHGGGWGWGLGGLAAGALIGAAIAAPYAWGDPYDAYDSYPVAYPAPYYYRHYYRPYGYVRPYWGRPVGWGPGWW